MSTYIVNIAILSVGFVVTCLTIFVFAKKISTFLLSFFGQFFHNCDYFLLLGKNRGTERSNFQ